LVNVPIEAANHKIQHLGVSGEHDVRATVECPTVTDGTTAVAANLVFGLEDNDLPV
jgi:hypothetical protein